MCTKGRISTASRSARKIYGHLGAARLVIDQDVHVQLARAGVPHPAAPGQDVALRSHGDDAAAPVITAGNGEGEPGVGAHGTVEIQASCCSRPSSSSSSTCGRSKFRSPRRMRRPFCASTSSSSASAEEPFMMVQEQTQAPSA